jgi:hypothetical protein
MSSKSSHPSSARLQEASSLLLVTALCGAGGALTTSTEAAIVSTPGISPSAQLNIPNTTAGVYVNAFSGVNALNPAGAPGWDINPWSASDLRIFANNSAETQNGVAALPSTPAAVANLPLGFIVDASIANFPRSPGTAANTWTLNASNYFGFRFTGDDAQLHYGWGRIDVGATLTVRSLAELYYESSPNTGIAVGGGAVPEPASAFLAAGAVGLMALRRRRQAV